MTPRTLVLVGDRDPGILAHRAIEASLGQLADELRELSWTWLATDRVAEETALLEGASGVWCVPGSPYRSLAGALAAIRFARLGRVPFLGTCGGFQHAVLELARDLVGVAGAAHAENDPGAAELVVTPLACALVERRAAVRPVAGSRFAAIVGGRELEEGFHCSYGLNPEWEARLAAAGVRVGARDPAGEVRAIELADHPFFLATLFQPERAALAGPCHPLVRAFAETGRLQALDPHVA